MGTPCTDITQFRRDVIGACPARFRSARCQAAIVEATGKYGTECFHGSVFDGGPAFSMYACPATALGELCGQGAQPAPAVAPEPAPVTTPERMVTTTVDTPPAVTPAPVSGGSGLATNVGETVVVAGLTAAAAYGIPRRLPGHRKGLVAKWEALLAMPLSEAGQGSLRSGIDSSRVVEHEGSHSIV